jgi:Xaa-Pro aminopeptidase
MKMSFLLLCALALGACAGVKTAYRTAAMDENALYATAYVLTEHYSIVLEQAAIYIDRNTLQEAQIAKLREVRDRVTPIVLAMHPLAEAYKKVKTPESTAALEEAIAAASVAIAEFITAVRGG